MKSIKFLTILFMSVLVLSSCEDEDKARFEFGEPGARAGSFVAVEFDESPAFNAADLEGSRVSGTVFAPADNVSSYTLSVSRSSGGESSEYAEVFSTETFPESFDISLADIMGALGLTLDDVVAGDQFDFQATSTSLDGQTVTLNNLDSDVQSEPGQKQAYNFGAAVSCPFVIEDLVGTYDVTALGFAGFFGETNFVRTIIAGPEDDQFTIVEGEFPSQNSDPLIVTVDLDTGNVEEVNEDGLSFDGVAQGFPPNTYLLIEGSVFSCIGFIDLRMNFSPFSGNPHDFILQKQ